MPSVIDQIPSSRRALIPQRVHVRGRCGPAGAPLPHHRHQGRELPAEGRCCKGFQRSERPANVIDAGVSTVTINGNISPAHQTRAATRKLDHQLRQSPRSAPANFIVGGQALVQELLQPMVVNPVNFTLLFRELSEQPEEASALQKSFYAELSEPLAAQWQAWLQRWRNAIASQGDPAGASARDEAGEPQGHLARVVGGARLPAGGPGRLFPGAGASGCTHPSLRRAIP